MNTRILPPEEWHKLADSGLPLLLDKMRERDAAVVVVEDEGKIVGTLGVLRLTHFEGVWVAPEYRSGFVLGRLLRAAEGLAAEAGQTWVLGGAANDDALMDGLIRRRGGVELPMRVYTMPLGVN